MANKKINSNQKEVANYLDLFYMTSSEVNAKEISEILNAHTELKVELWDSMNVLEFELPNQNTIDFEPVDVNFKDPSDNAFVKNRGIKTIFAITLEENDLNTVIPYFEQLISQYSGFLCADSADFNPVYAGSSKK